MQFPAFMVFVFCGAILFIVGGLARGYLRGQLKARGTVLPHWVTIADELNVYIIYVKEARKGYVPWWPIVLTITGMFGGMLISFTAMIAHNKHW